VGPGYVYRCNNGSYNSEYGNNNMPTATAPQSYNERNNATADTTKTDSVVRCTRREKKVILYTCFFSCFPGSLNRGGVCKGGSKELGLNSMFIDDLIGRKSAPIQFAQDIMRIEGKRHPRYHLKGMTTRENETTPIDPSACPPCS
jgi:hypothetical protein